MEDKKLREFIQKSIYEFLAEKKVLAEEKDGPAKPTSGLKKATGKTIHTDTKKEVKPKATKVTPESPEKSTLANAEPTEVESETKIMKDAKEPEADKSTFKLDDCYGAKLEVKGASYADINSLYLMGQIKKSLEGKGPRVKSVKIEMGDLEKVDESKEIKDLRKVIREIVKRELNKGKK